jgi:hypothetical protein
MAFSSNSMGFGAGPFGIGPFGHGPWITLPFTAQAVSGEGYIYETPVAVFENLTEQRFLLSRERGQNLTIDMAYVDSGRAVQVRSFFRAAGGAFTRFVARNYRTNAPYVTRFTGGALPVGFQAGAIWRMDPLTLRVDMQFPYAEQVRQDSAALYWRMDLASDQSTCANNTVISSASGKQWDLYPHTVPHSLASTTGAIANQDFNTAQTFVSGSNLYVTAGMVDFSAYAAFTIEAWAKTTSAAKRAIVSLLNGSAHIFLGMIAGGAAVFENTATNSTTVTGGSINDGAYHHVVGVLTAAYLALYVDGSMVSSRANASGTVGIGPPLWIGGYGANSFLASFGFTGGTIDEVAIYGHALPEAAIRRHYRVGAGID